MGTVHVFRNRNKAGDATLVHLKTRLSGKAGFHTQLSIRQPQVVRLGEQLSARAQVIHSAAPNLSDAGRFNSAQRWAIWVSTVQIFPGLDKANALLE